MIVREFSFPEKNLHYFVGINSLISKNLKLNKVFELANTIKSSYENIMIQFFNRNLILNSNHVFYASYHTFKAFNSATNISNKKSIEFLIYLAANRQIKRAIEDFGINDLLLHESVLDYCIISQKNNLNIITEHLLKLFNAKAKETNLNDFSIEKYNKIKDYFEFNENQIDIVLKSHGIILDGINPNNSNINNLYLAIEDLLCEKMALISIEKSSND